jgi:hypothetical protein
MVNNKTSNILPDGFSTCQPPDSAFRQLVSVLPGWTTLRAH